MGRPLACVVPGLKDTAVRYLGPPGAPGTCTPAWELTEVPDAKGAATAPAQPGLWFCTDHAHFLLVTTSGMPYPPGAPPPPPGSLLLAVHEQGLSVNAPLLLGHPVSGLCF